MDATFTRWLLDHIAFTQGLHPTLVERLAEIATPVQWGADETVFREGDADATLYLIDEGRVAIEASLPGRDPVTILTVGAGEVFGWSSIFYQRPKTASARTLAPTQALTLDATRLRALCDADPRLGYEIAQRLLQVVSERVKAHRQQMLESFKG
ncbi:MAG TPA: cyclic nucleotide-binding domain-containing protein [Isosphaeraceae bacterium]|nr:cyclic nucleotide-binding domain-containing protein [Isosphaeraceae bacterium]